MIGAAIFGGGIAMLEQAHKSAGQGVMAEGVLDELAEVVIREARDEDAAGVIAVVSAVFAEYPGCIFDLEAEAPELKQPASSFAAEGGKFWVAESRGEVVASCGFLPAEKPSGIELQRVYLRHDQRGSGLATRMFKIVLSAARAEGAEFIELWTDTRFHAAHRFYEKLGFSRSPGERLQNDLSRSSEYHYLLKLG
jgi:N-acetylglutamate synthase-like GNAT family acetyltransferase